MASTSALLTTALIDAPLRASNVARMFEQHYTTWATAVASMNSDTDEGQGPLQRSSSLPLRVSSNSEMDDQDSLGAFISEVEIEIAKAAADINTATSVTELAFSRTKLHLDTVPHGPAHCAQGSPRPPSSSSSTDSSPRTPVRPGSARTYEEEHQRSGDGGPVVARSDSYAPSGECESDRLCAATVRCTLSDTTLGKRRTPLAKAESQQVFGRSLAMARTQLAYFRQAEPRAFDEQDMVRLAVDRAISGGVYLVVVEYPEGRCPSTDMIEFLRRHSLAYQRQIMRPLACRCNEHTGCSCARRCTRLTFDLAPPVYPYASAAARHQHQV